MFQDLRFTLRLLDKDRWFSAAVVVALALGIGTNAAGFTIINAAFFRHLPFEQGWQLHMISWQTPQGDADLSYAELEDLRSQNRAFVGLAAFRSESINISDTVALPEHVRGAWMSSNAFDVLRQQPLLGRNFAAVDGHQDSEPVVIISKRLWIDRYRQSPTILGASMRINGRTATIIGVMPAGMAFPQRTEIWMPLIPIPDQQPRDARVLTVFGRLPTADKRLAEVQANHLARQLAVAYPDTSKDLLGAQVETVPERFVGGRARTMFLTMMGAVGFVLLIAIANVVNLLLSRSLPRRREIAVRMALGASRLRVVRQLLVESAVLCACGGVAGLMMAAVAVRLFDRAIQDPDRPYWIVFSIDYIVLAYVVVVCSVTAILCGLVPALQMSEPANHDSLKDEGRSVSGSRRLRWFSASMVVAQLALTIVLLSGAGLMVRSFINLQVIDSGVHASNVVTMHLQLPEAKYQTASARRLFYERLEDRVNGIAGIDVAAITTAVPPMNADESPIEIAGRSATIGERRPFVSVVTVSPRFFEVLGRQLLRGRAFDTMDGNVGAEHVIVNERLATTFFPERDAIGQQIRLDTTSGWLTIVAISPSIRHSSPQDAVSDPVVYIPYRLVPPPAATLLARSQLPPASVMNDVRRAVQAIDVDQPVFTIRTIDELLAERHWPYRAFGGAFTIFAGIALLLSSVGLYAVMAYSVTQRTAEIGIRMAVGAQVGQVTWMILKGGLVQLAAGLIIGLGAAVAMSQILRRMLVQVAPGDPTTLLTTCVLLSLIALIACAVPARRAALVDPLLALTTSHRR